MSEFNIEVQGGSSVRLPTAGKYCEKDIIVTASGGGEEFIGIRLSDFVNGYATTADLTSIPLTDNMRNDQKFFYYMFYESGVYGKLEEVYLPDGLTCFADCMFYRIRQLKHIYGNFSNVNTVIQYAFADTQLEEFPYMPTLETIGSKAFRYCKLKEIKFPTTITSIYSDAFLGCSNLTDIYCPWVEDAVANAPWGATNATIHYNTIYDENGNPIDCSCDPETEGCPDAES